MRRPGARKLAALVGAAVMVLALGAGPVLADPGERPGHGNGDTIHLHEDGPPGQDLEGENERPGWGTGDVGHIHDDGPPGQDLDDD